jgi:multiple sugar transport system permease protein/putative chitobiose transport system permease protein
MSVVSLAPRGATADTTRQPRRRRESRGRKSPLLTALSIVVGLGFALPALWILLDSFRPSQEIISSLTPLSWHLFIPSHLGFSNYVNLLTQDGFTQPLINSLIVSVVAVAVGVLISAMAGYALAVLRFKGQGVIFAIIVISFMVPFEAIAIPLSQLFSSWHLYNTLTGLILPGIGNGLAVFNIRQHFKGIPDSYREAAMLDGASEPRILLSLYCRMSGSALTNSALLIFISQWTAFLWPLIMVSNPSQQLAPVALASTFGQHTSDYGANFAGAVLLTLIPAVLLLVLRRVFGQISLSGGDK